MAIALNEELLRRDVKRIFQRAIRRTHESIELDIWPFAMSGVPMSQLEICYNQRGQYMGLRLNGEMVVRI